MQLFIKIRDKYNSLPVVAKAVLFGFLCEAFQKGINFFTVPIFTRILNPSEYGNVNLFLSWFAVISVFATLNLSAGVFNVGLTKFNDEQEQFSSSLLGLSFISTFIVFFLIFFLKFVFGLAFYLDKSNFLLMFIYVLVTPVVGLWTQFEKFKFRYKALTVVTVFVSLLNPTLGILLIKNFSTCKDYLRILSIVIVQVIISIPLFIVLIRRCPKVCNLNFWKYALKFNLPLIPHYLAMIILNSSDRIMINRYCGLEDTAFYSVAWSLSYAITIVTNSVFSSFNPYSFKKFKEKKFYEVGNIANILLLLIVTVCLCFIAVAPELLKFLAPPQYNKAVWCIPPLVGCSVFIFLYSLYGNIEFFFEKNRFIMIASTVGALLNIILNFIFIKFFGFIAAAYTSLFCYICFSVAHFVFAKQICKKNKIERVYNNKLVLLISFLFVLLCLFFTVLYRYFYIRYIFLSVVILLVFFFKKRIVLTLKKIKEEK